MKEAFLYCFLELSGFFSIDYVHVVGEKSEKVWSEWKWRYMWKGWM